MSRERVAFVAGVVCGVLAASPVAWVVLRDALDAASPANGIGFMVSVFFGACLAYAVFMLVALAVGRTLAWVLRV